VLSRRASSLDIRSSARLPTWRAWRCGQDLRQCHQQRPGRGPGGSARRLCTRGFMSIETTASSRTYRTLDASLVVTSGPVRSSGSLPRYKTPSLGGFCPLDGEVENLEGGRPGIYQRMDPVGVPLGDLRSTRARHRLSNYVRRPLHVVEGRRRAPSSGGSSPKHPLGLRRSSAIAPSRPRIPDIWRRALLDARDRPVCPELAKRGSSGRAGQFRR
jgi:hypothetical protein